MRISARVAAAARRLRRLPKTETEKTTAETEKTTAETEKTAETGSLEALYEPLSKLNVLEGSAEKTTPETEKTTTDTETTPETETAMKEKVSTIKKILYGDNYAENESGSLEALYEPLSKLNVLEGSAELALKAAVKGYSVKDLDAAEATKSLLKSASGYDQMEQSSMVKKSVHQGETIIWKLDQALAGIERIEKVLGSGGGGGGGSSGGGGGEGGGGGGGDGGSSEGVDFGCHLDFDPFL